jgi:putative membrane protein
MGAGLVAFYAYRRWAANEKAMRLNQSIKYTGFLKITSIVMVVFSIAAALVILL